MKILTAVLIAADILFGMSVDSAHAHQWRVPADAPTVSAAIAAATAGDTIVIAPGTYPENLVVTTPLILLGPNAGMQPGVAARGPEATITTSTNDTLGGTIVTIGASDVIIDGLCIDGDNPAISLGDPLNGVDVNAAWGITNDTTMSPAVQRLTVRYTIIRNCSRGGVRFRATGASASSSSGSNLSWNSIDNIASPGMSGTGIWLSDNFYVGIIKNQITRTMQGIVVSNFCNPGSPSIVEGNSVEAVATGIWHNLFRQRDPSVRLPLFLSRFNTVHPTAGSTSTVGCLVTSVYDTIAVHLEDNMVFDAQTGISIWNCPTKDTVRLIRDTLLTFSTGIAISNVHPLFGRGDTTLASAEGCFVHGPSGSSLATGIRLKDSSAGTTPVGIVLRNGTLIDQGDDGVVLEGAKIVLDAQDVDVGGQSQAYFRLKANDALSKFTGVIDATRVRFEGAIAGQLSESELFFVEQKIIHGTDLDGFGLIRVKAGWVFVNPGTGNIRRGINLASPGDRVRVFQGSYDESVVVPRTKNGIVLVGENSDRPVGYRTTETVIRGAVAILADRAVLNGFTISGGGMYGGDTIAVWLNGGSIGQQVKYSILTGPGQGLRRGILAGYQCDSVFLIGNQITGWTSGVYLNPSTAPHGVQILGNRLAANYVGIGSDGINNVLLRANTMTGNILEGWGYSDVEGVGGMNLVADSNTFSGNGIAIRNYAVGPAGDTLYAVNNAWGSVHGPLDSVGSVEVPEDPPPPLGSMKNLSPVGQLGDRVSEGVVYYPWIGDSRAEVQSPVAAGWNLMALGRRPSTLDPAFLFQHRTSSVFGFDNNTQNYVVPGVLDMAHGFWVKYDSSRTSITAGKREDSADVSASAPGWLLLGSLTDSAAVSSVTTDPAGARIGSIFRFNRTTEGYEPATTIAPGEGYWVKVNQPCTIRIR